MEFRYRLCKVSRFKTFKMCKSIADLILTSKHSNTRMTGQFLSTILTKDWILTRGSKFIVHCSALFYSGCVWWSTQHRSGFNTFRLKCRKAGFSPKKQMQICVIWPLPCSTTPGNLLYDVTVDTCFFENSVTFCKWNILMWLKLNRSQFHPISPDLQSWYIFQVLLLSSQNTRAVTLTSFHLR